jgi:deazaflavin-dependent oxidoreductase (nitroreductase family)
MARYLKPGFILARIANPIVMRLGLTSTLAVRGRTTGERRTVPVNVLDLDGTRYLVAPRGETQWARNLRAAGEGELRRRGRTERFRAVELPDEDKPPVLAAYRERWERQVKAQFEELPDPSDHPVFRILPG